MHKILFIDERKAWKIQQQLTWTKGSNSGINSTVSDKKLIKCDCGVGRKGCGGVLGGNGDDKHFFPHWFGGSDSLSLFFLYRY